MFESEVGFKGIEFIQTTGSGLLDAFGEFGRNRWILDRLLGRHKKITPRSVKIIKPPSTSRGTPNRPSPTSNVDDDILVATAVLYHNVHHAYDGSHGVEADVDLGD